jgi:hypothetical protein
MNDFPIVTSILLYLQFPQYSITIRLQGSTV